MILKRDILGRGTLGLLCRIRCVGRGRHGMGRGGLFIAAGF